MPIMAQPCADEEGVSLAKRSKAADRFGRMRGAIIAADRSSEGFKIGTGTHQTCLVDAVFNGMRVLGFKDASLSKMRSRAVPQLGNVRQASWDSVQKSLLSLGYLFSLVVSTHRFCGCTGGPMLALLNTRVSDPGVFIVGLHVIIDGNSDRSSEHAIMLSTIAEEHAPYGKLIDNHGKLKPVYLEKKDTQNKKKARAAFHKLIGQNPATHGCKSLCVTPSDVYQLVSTRP